MLFDLINGLLPILGGGEDGGILDPITGGITDGILDGLLEGLLGTSTGSFGSS